MLHCNQCQTVFSSTAMRCHQCGSEDALPTLKLPPQEQPKTDHKVGWGAIAYGENLILELHIGEHIFLAPLFPEHILVLGRGKAKEKISAFDSIPPLPDHNMLEQETDQVGKTVTPIDLTRYGGLLAGVSRQHALLQRERSLLVVADLNSTNSTWLNGKQLKPYHKRLLRYGDELQLGSLQIKVLFYR